jgi:Domain of unknown function (DUF5666)
MPRLTRSRLAVAVPVAVCAVGVGVAAAAATRGSISGPITSVKGSTFKVKTTLSPTGTATVTAGKKATITEEQTGKQSDLKKGVCVMASGTTKNKVVQATRISISGTKGCTSPFGGRRPNGQGPGGNGGTPPARNGNGNPGFKRPANFGFAFGTITKASGSTLTVKGFQGSTTVDVSGKTAITETAKVGTSALATNLCAFVFGTSSDKGVTVQATSVALSKPVNGSCQARRRPGP